MIPLLAFLTALKDVHIEVPASGYRLDAALGGIDSDEIKQETRFILRGHAVAASKAMEFRSETVRGLFYTPKGGKKSVLKHAETPGKGSMTRTVQAQGTTETTTLLGSRFVFDGDASLGQIKVDGPVQIDDGGNSKSSLHMTGDKGSAQFDMQQKAATDALRKAVLDGHVLVTVIGSGKNAGTVHAKGDHMVLDNTVTPHTMTLTGNVSLEGDGKTAVGTTSGLQKVKFLLNRQGQFTHVTAGEAPN